MFLRINGIFTKNQTVVEKIISVQIDGSLVASLVTAAHLIYAQGLIDIR
jgi:hypothetical protein